MVVTRLVAPVTLALEVAITVLVATGVEAAELALLDHTNLG